MSRVCAFCFTCSKVCPTKAITSVPESKARIGTAVVLEQYCIGCERCIPVCPEDAVARRKDEFLVKVDEDKCTGCRAWVVICPYKPKGIKVINEKEYRPVQRRIGVK